MNRTSKDKLNAMHLGGTIGVAALIGAIAESWVLFILVTAALIGASLFTGEIRPPTRYGRPRK